MKKEIKNQALKHSASHLLASAVLELFPKAKPAIGPAIEDGFYYDFDNLEITESDLKKIEKKMRQIAEKNSKFTKKQLSKAEAEKLVKNNYKKEILSEIKNKITFYTHDKFTDLCEGPHIDSTKELRHFKLMKIAGAYWRGNSKNKMLTRIYGIIFPTEKELKEHLFFLEEAKKRDHVKLGKQLDLFVINEAVGKGLPLLTPRGATLKRILRRFIVDEELKRGYQYTETPVMAKSELYKISGHLDHYKDSMFIFESNGEEMALRPMTCPHQFMIYKSKLRSYRELPIKYAEVAELFRNEQTGELHGLMRVRQFTLADAHIICMPEQLEKEFEEVVNLVQYVMKSLGFKDYWYRFSKWDPNNKEKYIDDPKAWADSQKMMKKIIDKLKIKYEEEDGEAAFYGPKLDVQMKNVYGKEDTIFTIQIDFALPERFDMKYEGQDGRKHRPMIIHRSSIGALERTMAMLIEHYAGKLPLWLSPVQVKVLTVADRNLKFAEQIYEKLKQEGIRVELDRKTQSISKKVRDAQMEKINYMVTLGDKEEEGKTLAIRTRDGKVSFGVKVDTFIKNIKKEINDHK
jgi:threonyl-tRNA synthetase